MTVSAATKTAAEVISAVKRQFGDEAGVQITDEDIIRWINSGQLKIVDKTDCLKAVSKTNVTEGVFEFDLSALMIKQIESVHYLGKRVPSMDFVAAERYIEDHDLADRPSGSPEFWYTYGNILYLYPTPDVTTADALSVYYTKLPTSIVQGTDPLSVPDTYYEILLSYVMSKAYQLDEEFDAASFAQTSFDQELGTKQDQVHSSSHMTYPTIAFLED